jgi:hypothetical protein
MALELGTDGPSASAYEAGLSDEDGVLLWTMRSELRHGDTQRAEDHKRQGRCSHRPHGRRRLARAYFRVAKRPGCSGPSQRRPLACPECANVPRAAPERHL